MTSPECHKSSSVRRWKGSWLLAAIGFVVLSFAQVSAQITVSPTYPPLTSFLYGNTSVNAVGQTSFVSGSGWNYRYITPKNFNSSTKYPVIIYLHGSGETGSDDNSHIAAGNSTAYGALTLVSTANPDNQTNYPCFFIAPQAPVSNNWSTEAAATAIQNLINTFKTQYPNSFDTTRIYLTGSSMGGIGSYDLPVLLAKTNHLGSNPFACLVPMSAEVGYFDGRSATTQPNIPMWVFHGVQDQTVPIATGSDSDVPVFRAMGDSVIYTRYATGPHIIWGLAYQHPQLLPWMFSQKLGQANQPLSNFVLTDVFQTGTSSIDLGGTAATDEGFSGISWANMSTGQSGSATGAITPTWSILGIPLGIGTNLIQTSATAPNNTALVYGVSTNYGGTMTVNIPYAATGGAGATNIAVGKPVTVSSSESAANQGSAAVDNNTTTRWSSLYSDPQWISVDLGANYNIQEVDLNWETACGRNYQVQTSTDGVNWNLQTNVSNNSTNGLHTYPYGGTLPVARYVRMYGTARATGWGYSLYEFAIYGTAVVAPPPPPPGTVSVVSLNKTVTVSSTDTAEHAGSAAVDSSSTTRWSSNYGDPQWISVDLGATYSISKVTLTWETACGRNYLIQSSSDGVSWTTQTAVTGNTSTGLLTYNYATQFSARYVRMYGTARATYWGYSLFDFSVYGQ